MKTIEISEEQWQMLQEGRPIAIEPSKKWEPKGGEFCIDLAGVVYTGYSAKETREFGTVYPTELQAERAARAMRKHTRLLAYTAEFDANWEPNWNDSGQTKCEVFFDHNIKEWRYRPVWTQEALTIPMSPACAKGLIEKLNNERLSYDSCICF